MSQGKLRFGERERRHENRWIGLSSKMDEETNDGEGIQISVQDHGVGTNNSDLPQIFEAVSS